MLLSILAFLGVPIVVISLFYKNQAIKRLAIILTIAVSIIVDVFVLIIIYTLYKNTDFFTHIRTDVITTMSNLGSLNILLISSIIFFSNIILYLFFLLKVKKIDTNVKIRLLGIIQLLIINVKLFFIIKYFFHQI